MCRYAALSAQQNSEEAIDIVLIESYSGAGTMWKGKKQYKYTPFNPNDKCTVSYVLEEQSGKKYKLLKGAPQVRIQLCGAKSVATVATVAAVARPCTGQHSVSLATAWGSGPNQHMRQSPQGLACFSALCALISRPTTARHARCLSPLPSLHWQARALRQPCSRSVSAAAASR